MITDWLTRTPEELVMKGKGEAYCKLCLSPLRAHKTDLEKHMKSKVHIEHENATNTKKQAKLSSFGKYYFTLFKIIYILIYFYYLNNN